MEIEKFLLFEDQNILDALKKLNDLRDLSRLILFVRNKDNTVVGSLTDGDIRRSLAKDADIHKSVGKICNRNFTYETADKNFLSLGIFRNTDIKILPLLNDKRELVKVIDLEKKRSILPLECMIMAGGRGKRLSPLTDTIPKPMLPLGDKPIIEHNIDRLISFGIEKIYISVKYLGEQIQDYFGDGSSKGIKIEYIWEDEPLGTAGALSRVEKFDTKHLILMNSDLFTNVDFEEMYLDLINSEAQMAIASTEYKIDVPYAVFETENQSVREFKEKPSYVYYSNAGIYIMDRNLIQRIPKNQFYDITDLIEDLVAEGKVVHSPIRGYWIDIGNPRDYQQAQEFSKHSKL